MKLNFVIPLEDSKNLIDLIGKTEAEIEALQDKFSEAMNSGVILRPIDVVVWCADNAETIEETLIYSIMALDAVNEFLS